MSAYTHHGDCSTSDPCKRCFQFGQTTEQKRIIKLLEDADSACSSWAVALIKGEK